MDKPIGKLKLLTTKGEVVDAILYCHQETTTVGGTTYRLLKKDTPADASGITLSASTASVARVVWDKFVFQLTGISKILSATIYATYRAYTGGGTVNAEIDIKILRSNGIVRTTIATGVSKSANLGTAWATYTGANYSFAEYTVVDETDYLEIDYIANVTAKKSGAYAYLRIDDQTLNQADQTRSQEWSFSVIKKVLTKPATNVKRNQATLNGEIVNFTATIRGFEWGKQSGNYTDSWTEEGSFPAGTYSKTITNLDENTTYYYRAKAYSSETGWLYGEEKSFLTSTTLWLTATEIRTNAEIEFALDFDESTEYSMSNDFFARNPTLIGIRVWKRNVNGEETEITDGTPVAQADISTFPTNGVNVKTGTWTISSAIPLSETDKLVVRVYIYVPSKQMWFQLLDPSEVQGLAWVSGNLNASQISPSTITVYYYIFYHAEFDQEFLEFGGEYLTRLENVWLTAPTGAVETIVAKNFPMDYLPSPAKATQLTSKISGATITKNTQDYPLTLLKKDKAQELKSKWT
jgi:hypothetical protein